MKIIVFDLFSAQPKQGIKFHGGGEYIKTVFKVLLETIKTLNITSIIHVCFDTENYIDEWISLIIGRNNLLVHSVKNEREIVDVLYELDGTDITFYTGMIYLYGKDKVQFPEGVRTIGTCHGLRLLEKPYDIYAYKYGGAKVFFKELLRRTICKRYLYNKYYNEFKNSLENFKVIITVSEHSSYAIRTHLPEVAKNIDIRVLYTPMKVTHNQYTAVDKNYIMMISADRWLKNAFRGVCAIDDLYSKGCLSGVKTKVLGNYPVRLRRQIANLDKFEFYGYVDNDELEKMYAECSIFFYPSLNEGFGLPPIEAMKYGKTCIISGVCSLPEIYENTVYYCNPYDVQEMENRLLKAIEYRIDTEIIKKRLNKIIERQKEDLIQICNLIIGGV